MYNELLSAVFARMEPALSGENGYISLEGLVGVQSCMDASSSASPAGWLYHNASVCNESQGCRESEGTL